MMFRANCRLSVPGTFIPIRMPLSPLTCAESIAASPSTTTLPCPSVIASPWPPVRRPVRCGPECWDAAGRRQTGKLEQRYRTVRPLERLPGECQHAVDPLRAIAAHEDRVVAEQPVHARKIQLRRNPRSALAGSSVVLLPISTPSLLARSAFDAPQG